jgi:hypothetical protein
VVVVSLAAVGLPMLMVNLAQLCAFGEHAKTDPIDARMIAHFVAIIVADHAQCRRKERPTMAQRRNLAANPIAVGRSASKQAQRPRHTAPALGWIEQRQTIRRRFGTW